ncbi:uncharacterized protein LOC110837175 [Zootermopsis nevadensis]|uniref:Uncharacterized protein n=1 Tax=Zootermopsis nevadensis TaxID=136037 RepID=A0A067QYI1_ZOONE|nr:uncharacterized protein LOC110837175 [Zootermopsis nevadensis]KDR11337.1 hypothetical protein L798_14879 [Zootermopsis nevadensis]
MNKLQGAATQQMEVSTLKMETVTPVSASSELKGGFGRDTDKLDAISQSPLVEKNGNSSASSAQLKENTDQSLSAVKKYPASVRPRYVTPQVSISERDLTNDQRHEKFSDIVTKLDAIHKGLKGMRIAIEQIFPDYIAELLHEETTLREDNVEASGTPDKADEGTGTDKEIFVRIETLKETFNKIISNYGKHDTHKSEIEALMKDPKNVVFLKKNSQVVEDLKAEDDDADSTSPSSGTAEEFAPE